MGGIGYHTCMSEVPFSAELEKWLKSKGDKTVSQLSEVAGERTFAITILFLMFLPALPLPTGGITHVFEVVAMLLALEMVVGMQTIWLPKRWQSIPLGKRMRGQVLPFMMRRIRWFERYSRPRLSYLLNTRGFTMFSGVMVLVFTLTAFFAPPFSGLDTLPALGVVVICLSLILEDFVLFVIGSVIGTLGIGLIIGLGAVISEGISRLL